MIHKDLLKKITTGFKMGISSMYQEKLPSLQGEVFVREIDPGTGDTRNMWSKKNLIVLDSSLLIAALLKDNQEPNFGINMLAVGTGATGAILNPDAPLSTQRRLNNELARKSFSEITFRDSSGGAVSYRTSVVDFTCVFSQSEAVGPWNEMALMSTISGSSGVTNPNPNFSGAGGETYDPTVDTSLYDTLVNYLTFSVMSKPNNAIMAITWRITT